MKQTFLAAKQTLIAIKEKTAKTKKRSFPKSQKGGLNIQYHNIG